MQGRYTRGELGALLSSSFMFSELNSDEIDKVIAVSRLQQVAARETVFSKGTACNRMFLVLSGRLKIQSNSADGKTITLDYLEPTATFGVLGVLDGKPRQSDVVSVTSAELLAIERGDFLSLLEQHPKLSYKAMQVLCRKLRNTNEFLENMVFLNLPKRLAKMLKLLSSTYGTEAIQGIQFDVKISQSELANLVGSSRESVNKQLKAWEAAGLVTQLESGRIHVNSQLLNEA